MRQEEIWDVDAAQRYDTQVLACSPQRCWGRRSTGWPSMRATAERWSSQSEPVGSRSPWPSAAFLSPVSSCPVR